MSDPSKSISLKEKLLTAAMLEDARPADLKRAILIHNQTMVAVNNFHSLFVESHSKRPEFGGDQDLLRAMLLFSCSGLDAVVKQLVRDALETVLQHDEGAQGQFQKFVERRLKKGVAGDGSTEPDISLLARVLVSFDARATLIGTLRDALAADSLQSVDQLSRVASQFAITNPEVIAQDNITKQAFQARNQIAHEMDAELTGGQGRRHRGYVEMVLWTENIAEISRSFIDRVGEKITQGTRGLS